MERRKTVLLREPIQSFWRENPELYHKMLEARVERLWGELFGPSIAQYTSHVYVKNRTLHVSMTSSVVRSELLSMRKRLVTTLNEQAKSNVIDDIVIQ